MRFPPTFKSVRREKIPNNNIATTSCKIPRVETIASAGNFGGQIGDILFTINDSTFWGNNGDEWIKLTGSTQSFQIVTILDTANAAVLHTLPSDPQPGYTEIVRMLTKQGNDIIVVAPPIGTALITSANSVATFYYDTVSDPNNPVYKILGANNSFYPTNLTATLFPIGGAITTSDSCAVSGVGNTIVRFGAQTNLALNYEIWVWTKSADTWAPLGTLVPTGASGQIIGLSTSLAVSADASTIAVGSINDTQGPGAVWIFNNFEQTAKLIATGMTGAQGAALALSANGSILAMASEHDSNICIFANAGSGFEQSIITPTSVTTVVCSTVALNANGNVLAAAGLEGTRGAVWLFFNSVVGWSETAKFLLTNGQNPPSICLSANGQTMAVLDQQTNEIVNVYNYNFGWQLQAQIAGKGTLSNVVNLSADGNKLVISGPQMTMPFVYNRQGDYWYEIATLSAVTGITAGPLLQSAGLSADGNTFVLGGQTVDGAVYVYN